jgi:hypothetical protein
LGLTNSRRAVRGLVLFVKDEAIVKFGQWNIDADFGHGEDGTVAKNVADRWADHCPEARANVRRLW